MCGLLFVRGEHASNGALALEKINHRGRDSFAEEFHPREQVYLGHRRLAITGKNGRQPIWNKEKTVACLVNGQFYNARNESDYNFSTDTDSELALAFYVKGGEDALRNLNGEFALVIWDTAKKKVIAMRDSFGVRPLKFYVAENNLIIASEAKSLEAFFDLSLDKSAVSETMSLQYIRQSTTIFSGVEQVAPGETVIFDLANGPVTFSRQKWFSLFDIAPHAPTSHQSDNQKTGQKISHPNKNPKEKSLEEKSLEEKSLEEKSLEESHARTDHFLSTLQQAVASRVDTDLKIAVHVSGGCDSSTVALLASRQNKNIHGFCVEFEETKEGHNETPVAEKTCRLLGIPFTPVRVTRMDIVKAWPMALRAAESFGINGHFAAKWLLAKRIHEEGIRVSLSGEGADEVLLGYPFLQAEVLDAKTVTAKNPISQGSMLPLDHARLEGEIVDILGFVPVWLRAKLAFGDRLHALMKKDEISHQKESVKTWGRAAKNLLPRSDQVHQSASLWASFALGQYILPALADAPESFFHIQGRMPFLDQRVCKSAENLLMTDLGFPQKPKEILRDFLRKNGLSHVADRPKQPFDAPPLLGSPPVRGYLRDLFLSESYKETVFEKERMKKWINSWDFYSESDCQHAEPVVCLILSYITAKKNWSKKNG